MLEMKFDTAAKTVAFRWQADEPGLEMLVKVEEAASWRKIHPSSEWSAEMPTSLAPDEFEVATDLYYVDFRRVG